MEIKALISYEGKDANELVSDFHCAIDDYLEFCNIQGKKPEKAYTTSYNTSLNNFVENAKKTCCSCIIISIFKKSHFFKTYQKNIVLEILSLNIIFFFQIFSSHCQH